MLVFGTKQEQRRIHKAVDQFVEQHLLWCCMDDPDCRFYREDGKCKIADPNQSCIATPCKTTGRKP